jgi:iron complex outermembrane receptor protein
LKQLATSDNLEQQFSYQQQSGQIQQQHRLDDLLPKQLNCSIIATFGKVQVGNSLTHYFDANEVGPSEQQGESYTLWHTSVSYQVKPQQSIILVINNLTNESYFGSLDEDAPLQPERNIKLTSTWQC